MQNLAKYIRDANDPQLRSVGDNGVDDGGRRPDREAPRDERYRRSDDVVDLGRRP